MRIVPKFSEKLRHGIKVLDIDVAKTRVTTDHIGIVCQMLSAFVGDQLNPGISACSHHMLETLNLGTYCTAQTIKG